MLILIAVKPKRSVDLIHVLRVLCLQGCLCSTVTLHRPRVLRGALAFHLCPWLSRGGQGCGESGQRSVTDVRRHYNESCQLECSLVAIFFYSGKKKPLTFDRHIPLTPELQAIT